MCGCWAASALQVSVQAPRLGLRIWLMLEQTSAKEIYPEHVDPHALGSWSKNLVISMYDPF